VKEPRTRCVELVVDGLPVRCRVSGRLTERDMEALRAIARAAQKHLGAIAEVTLPMRMPQDDDLPEAS